jgi:hypothetical protein
VGGGTRQHPRQLDSEASVGIWAASSRSEPLPLLAKRFLTTVGNVLRAGPPHQI